MKASGGKHIADFVAASREGTPSCSCKGRTRWQWNLWSWNTLPKQYIESACLLTDDEALVAYFW